MVTSGQKENEREIGNEKDGIDCHEPVSTLFPVPEVEHRVCECDPFSPLRPIQPIATTETTKTTDHKGRFWAARVLLFPPLL